MSSVKKYTLTGVGWVAGSTENKAASASAKLSVGLAIYSSGLNFSKLRMLWIVASLGSSKFPIDFYCWAKMAFWGVKLNS